MTDPSILVGYKQPDLSAPSPRTPVWLWIITLLLLGVVVFIQQAGQEPAPTRADRQAAAAGLNVEPPGVDMLVLFGRLVLFVNEYAPQHTREFMRVVEEQAGVKERPVATVAVAQGADGPSVGGVDAAEESTGGSPADAEDQPETVHVPLPLERGPPLDEGEAPADASGIAPGDGTAPAQGVPAPAVNRFRVALLEAEAYGTAPAVERLALLVGDLDAESPLHADIAAALKVYADGPDALDAGAADELVERHGWFGRLLLSYGRPESDPFRSETLGLALWGFTFLTILMVGVVFAIVSGIVILIVGGVLALSGGLRPAMARPRPGNRLWLETFAVFLTGFLAVQGVMILVSMAAPDAPWLPWVRLGSQWSLALLVFWPLARGMSFERFRGEVGWHRGRGFFNEVGAGMLAYLAALPIYFGLAVIMVSVMMAYRQFVGEPEDAAPPLPGNRLTDILGQGGIGMMLLLASLVVLWAPLVEETIFRGALYRAVRSPLGVLGAALLTGVIFAVMHGYAAMQLILVGTLGVIFAFIREWRGSLLPSIVAHCVHNSIVLMVMIVVIQLAHG